MTLNPSAEINTNDLQSPGGVTSLYKSERQKKERRKTGKFTHCTEESPTTFFGGEGGVLLCVFFFFFAYEEVRTSCASSPCSSQLGYCTHMTREGRRRRKRKMQRYGQSPPEQQPEILGVGIPSLLLVLRSLICHRGRHASPPYRSQIHHSHQGSLHI